MSDLVKHHYMQERWTFLPIKEFARTTSGGTPKRSVAKYYGGNVPWIKSGDLNDGILNSCEEFITELGLEKSSAKLFHSGTLLIALYGATIGKLAILNFEATTNQAVCGILLPDNIDTKYVFYYLLSIRQQLIEQGKGGAQPNINQQIIKNTITPIAPPEQQKRIVAKIEKLFSHIDVGIKALQKAKQLLKQYRQSVLKAAVTGELTKEWREANKGKLEPASQLLQRILKERRQKWEEQQLEKFKSKGKVPKDDKWKEKYKESITPTLKWLGELPTDWAWGGIEELSSHIVDCLHSTAIFTESGKYCIDTNCLKEGYIPFNQVRFVSEETFEERVRRLKPMEGDILFSREGTIGLAALVPENTDLCLGQRMMMFRADTILPEYFMWALLSSVFVAQWQPRVMGTTAPHINIGDIRIMALPLPPIEEQSKIVRQIEAKLNSTKRMEAEIDIQISRAGKSKQSVLASAFSGELSI